MRYIDADKLEGYLKRNADILFKSDFEIKMFLNEFYAIPTEDVVPRAEVKQRYQVRADGTLEMIPTVESVRQEVAREIFEKLRQEIKSAIDSNYKVKNEHFARHHYKNPNDEFMNIVSGKILALRGIDDFVDELENKYIGE